MVKITALGSHRCMSGWRAVSALWLLSIAMLLRAAVPAGYMLDSRALNDGRIELSFCSAAGDISFISIPLAPSQDGPSHHNENASMGSDCPFGLFNHIVPALPEAGSLFAAAVANATAVVFAGAYHALPALPAQGPPLGSRAPPSILG